MLLAMQQAAAGGAVKSNGPISVPGSADRSRPPGTMPSLYQTSSAFCGFTLAVRFLVGKTSASRLLVTEIKC